MFLVTGATGNVGREIVQQLVGAGAPVRALVRRPDVDLPPGAERAIGDLNDPAAVAAAATGVRGVFLLSGYAELPTTLAGLRDAGVEHIVLLSSSNVPGGDLTNAVARYHIESEAAVTNSGIPWTFLRPVSFMTNTLQWLPQLHAGNTVRATFPNVAVATVDPHDIGAVAVAAFTNAHTSQIYPLTGPESLRPADRVRILGEVLGRELSFVGLTDDEARAELHREFPAQYADAFMRFFADGDLDESQVLPTVETVTGRAPRTFTEWATANAEKFTAAT